MKKILSVLAAAAMVLTATACSSNSGSSSAADSTADSVADSAADTGFKIEKLRVGSDVAYPPFEYYDADGVTPIGVDMELAEALGEKLGCEVEIVNTAW
ncbi:MAG: transporter substrate-binding domain-containing protein, partial [Oscillospiraceae bacterium]